MLPNPQETVDLLTFTEEIPHRKFHFLRSESLGHNFSLQKKIYLFGNPLKTPEPFLLRVKNGIYFSRHESIELGGGILCC